MYHGGHECKTLGMEKKKREREALLTSRSGVISPSESALTHAQPSGAQEGRIPHLHQLLGGLTVQA